jgi:hypothetical protein
VFPTITRKAPGYFDLHPDWKLTTFIDDHIPGTGRRDDDDADGDESDLVRYGCAKDPHASSYTDRTKHPSLYC